MKGMFEEMKNLFERRIGYVDFLKFIGLTGIILAHVGSPSWLMMLRSFDVPLMVILSSMLGKKSFEKYQNNNLRTLDYYLSRVKRLVIPTWIFLLIYFGIYYIASGKLFSLDYYVASFCLTRYGIGYVWIILIYLYSALLLPIFSKAEMSKIGLLCVAVMYVIYEVLYYFKVGINYEIIDTTFYYIIPYGTLTYLGCNYNHMTKKTKKCISITSLAIFVGMALYYWYKCGTPQLVQIAKYPPRLYYMSYGITASFILMLLCENVNLKLYSNKAILFISKHSMWIYLWHVLVLLIYSALGLPKVWYIKLIVVYSISIIIVLIMNKILDFIEKKRTFKILSYFRG